MRTLKYLVLGATPLLAAAGFAQGLSVGMKDGAFLEAQAGDSNPMNGQASPKAPGGSDRMSDPKAADPMTSPAATGKDKNRYESQGHSDKRDSTTDGSSQVSKGKKQQPKDSGG